jgi:hypothetical protein
MRSVVALLILLVAPAAWAGHLGVAWDPSGHACELQIQPDAPGAMYVLAWLDGSSVGGIVGAEFRVVNFPAGWPATVTPNPAAIVSLGDPLGAGCQIGFPSCQQAGAAGVLLLYTVSFAAVTPVSEHVVTVDRHSLPGTFGCPMLDESCCSPCGFFSCAGIRAAAINFPGYCAVSVAPTTWSGLRDLYR